MDLHGENGEVPNAPDEGYCTLCQRQFKGRRGLSSHNVVHRKKAPASKASSEAAPDVSVLAAAGFDGDQALDPLDALNPQPIPPLRNPPPIPPRPNLLAIPPPPGAGAAKVRDKADEPQVKEVPKPSATPVPCSSSVLPKCLRTSNCQSVLLEKIYVVKDAAYEETQLSKKTVAQRYVQLTRPLFMEQSPFHTPAIWQGVRNLQETALKMGVNRKSACEFNLPAHFCEPADNRLLIRFCVNPSPSFPLDKRPHNLAVRVNGKDILRPEKIDYRSTIKYNHAYSPIELDMTNVTGGAWNVLVVEWTVDDSNGPAEEFFMFLQVAKKKTMDTLCTEVSQRRFGVDQSSAKLYRDLAKHDDEISGNSRTLSLICGLSQKRLQIPSRGKDCRHIECFNLASFIEMNQGLNARWNCSICKKPVLFDDLVVDEFIADLLKRFPGHKLVDVVAENGCVRVREQKKAESKISKCNKTIDLDMSDSVIIL